MGSTEGLPLIPIPHLLRAYLEARNRVASCNARLSKFSRNAPIRAHRKHLEERHAAQLHLESFRSQIDSIGAKSILDFPSEVLAKCIYVVYHYDISQVNVAAIESFHKYLRGWIAHVALVGCSTDANTGAAALERIIEIAGALDILYRTHTLAQVVAEALVSEPISRLSTWAIVRRGLKGNIDRILQNQLAPAEGNMDRFDQSRDHTIEYWVLSRAYVADSDLWTESLAIEVDRSSDLQNRQVRGDGEIEEQLGRLEDLLGTVQGSTEQFQGDDGKNNGSFLASNDEHSTSGTRSKAGETIQLEFGGQDSGSGEGDMADNLSMSMPFRRPEGSDTSSLHSISNDSDDDSLSSMDDNWRSPIITDTTITKLTNDTKDRVTLRLAQLKVEVITRHKKEEVKVPQLTMEDGFVVEQARATNSTDAPPNKPKPFDPFNQSRLLRKAAESTNVTRRDVTPPERKEGGSHPRKSQKNSDSVSRRPRATTEGKHYIPEDEHGRWLRGGQRKAV